MTHVNGGILRDGNGELGEGEVVMEQSELILW